MCKSDHAEFTEYQAYPHLNATSFPAQSVEYNHGAIKLILPHDTIHPFKYSKTG